MRCSIIVELQGVLGKPLYTTFTKLVNVCNGRIRTFNQETNEFLIILNHNLKKNVCPQINDIINLCNYCLGFVRLHIVIENDNDKDRVLKLARSKGELVKAYDGYRFIVKYGKHNVIGLYNLKRNIVSLYVVDKPIEKFKLMLMSVSEIHDYVITNCSTEVFKEHYSTLRTLCNEFLIGSP